MRSFVWFLLLLSLSLSVGDKLDRTYLPPPGYKLSGGSDGDLIGPLDYSRPTPTTFTPEGPSTFGSKRPSGLGFPVDKPSSVFAPKRPVAFGSDQTNSQGSDASQSFFGSNQSTDKGIGRESFEQQRNTNSIVTTKGPLESISAKEYDQENNQEPQRTYQNQDNLSRLPIPDTRSRINKTGASTLQQSDYTKSRFTPTKISSRFETTPVPIEYNFQKQDQVKANKQTSGTQSIIPESKQQYFDVNDGNTPLKETIQDLEPTNDFAAQYKSSQTSIPKNSDNYPQEQQSGERDIYRQSMTKRPISYTTKEQEENIPSQRPNVNRFKSNRPSFRKPIYPISTERQNEFEYERRNNFGQTSTVTPRGETQDENQDSDDSRTTIETDNFNLSSIDEAKVSPGTQYYTTASPIGSVEEDGQKYNGNEQIYRTDTQPEKEYNVNAFDTKYSTPSAPSFRNNAGTYQMYKQRPERPQAENDRNAVIINYTNDITPDGNFAYTYDTSNGIHADENGTASDGVKANGSFSYIGDDGKFYSVIYSADENGFQPKGDHLPTPPPIPEAILRVIEQAQRDKEAGISNDGSYDESKYGYKKYVGAGNRHPQKTFYKEQDNIAKDSRPDNQQNKGQYESSSDKEYSTDDSKDYLDVEDIEAEVKPENDSIEDTNEYPSANDFIKPVSVTTNKKNVRPGAPQKQIEYRPNTVNTNYNEANGNTGEVNQDDDIRGPITTTEDKQMISKLTQNVGFDKPSLVNSQYDSSHRGYKKQPEIINETYKQADGKPVQVPSVQNEAKYGQSQPRIKNVESASYDNTPNSFNEMNFNYTQGQNSPTKPKINQNQFERPKYNNKPGILVNIKESFSKLPKIGQNIDRYSTQMIEQPSDVKVDGFGREIPQEDEIKSAITDIKANERIEEQESTRPKTYNYSNKKYQQNRYNQEPVSVNEEKGYDYISPQSKFSQEPSRFPSYDKQAPSIDDITSAEDGNNSGIGNKPFNGRVTGKPINSQTKPISNTDSPISNSEEEFDFDKEYPKSVKDVERQTYRPITSTAIPYYKSGSRVTIKPITTIEDSFENKDDGDDGKRLVEQDYDIQTTFNQRGQKQPIQRPTPSLQYSKTTTKPFIDSFGDRRQSFTKDQVPRTTYRPVFSKPGTKVDSEDERYSVAPVLQNVSDNTDSDGKLYSQGIPANGSGRKPTVKYMSTLNPTSNESPTVQDNVRTYFDRNGPQKMVATNSYEKPFDKYSISSTKYGSSEPATDLEDERFETKIPVPTVEENKRKSNENRIPQRVTTESVYRKPVDRLTTLRPIAEGARFNERDGDINQQVKVSGEDFSGPQQPQYYDTETGYHY